jgi:hypothetical protein
MVLHRKLSSERCKWYDTSPAYVSEKVNKAGKTARKNPDNNRYKGMNGLHRFERVDDGDRESMQEDLGLQLPTPHRLVKLSLSLRLTDQTGNKESAQSGSARGQPDA